MGWIEDHFGNVLLVKQKAGKRLWSLPGGKVLANEGLMDGLRRELHEEVGLVIDVAAPLDFYDRPEKSKLTILFRVILSPRSTLTVREGEIEKFSFRNVPPVDSTSTLKHFWSRAQRTFEPMAMF